MVQPDTGVLLCLGCPAGITFGIDTQQWQLGPKFCGVQRIPPGLHFVFHSAGHDARCGEFVHVSGGDVLVRRWDESLETFAQGSGKSADETERAVAAVREGHYAQGLGHYPPDTEARWRRLCRHITASTLARVGVPVGTRVVPGDAELAAGGEQQQPGQLTPYFDGLARTPRFAPVAARRRFGMTAAQITAYNLSPEARLAQLLAGEYSGHPAELLGEFELAFVLFLLLSSLTAFEHWKATVHLVSVCDSSVAGWPQLALGLLTTLTEQLALTPEDMFQDAMTSDNFLRSALASLARSSTAASAPEKLRSAGLQLRSYVQSRFTLHLSPTSSADSLEDAPVVVDDLDAAQEAGTSDAPDALGGSSADSETAAQPAALPQAQLPAERAEPQHAAARMDWMLPAAAT